jgi:hypothetical protein
VAGVFAEEEVSLFFRIAAYACLIGGVLLGVVSVAGLVYFGTALLQAGPPPVAGAAPEGSVVLSFFHGLGKTLSFFTGIADGIIKAFAVGSAVGLTFGILLVQTGRGLRAERRWAKALVLVLAPVVALTGFAAASILGFV